MQQKLSHYIRVDTNSHSDSEGSTSGIGTATDNAYHILPASDSPVSSYRFSTSTTTSLVYSNGKFCPRFAPTFLQTYRLNINKFLFVCLGAHYALLPMKHRCANKAKFLHHQQWR